VKFDTCSITKSGSIAIFTTGGTKITAFNCNLSQNYFYGVDDRDGAGNKYIANRFISNGDTGVATSTGGRGINLWRCVGCHVSDCDFVGNSEYGFRIYSEAADASGSYGNTVDDCYFEDNASADIVLYDESLAGSLVKKNTLANCTVRRSTNPTLGQSVLFHGGDNTMDGIHVFKEGVFGTGAAFYLYYGVRNRVINCSASNIADALVFSNASDCVVDGFIGTGVATAAGVAGFSLSGNVIRNSSFTHGGAGVADVGIVCFNATGKNFIENVRLDGFQYGVYVGDEAVSLRGVVATNSTSAGFRKDGDVQAGQELVGNSWDSANPALLQDIERRDGSKAVGRYTAAPTIRTWAVGDRVFNATPSAGQPKSWVCTVAGTPGTWVSEGNL
jgi:hypothetical protein